MRERDASVLLVGAGPTGLVLALVLVWMGIPVRIVDRKLERPRLHIAKWQNVSTRSAPTVNRRAGVGIAPHSSGDA